VEAADGKRLPVGGMLDEKYVKDGQHRETGVSRRKS